MYIPSRFKTSQNLNLNPTCLEKLGGACIGNRQEGLLELRGKEAGIPTWSSIIGQELASLGEVEVGERLSGRL